MGHNLGLYHDFDGINGGNGGPCHDKGLMSYDMDLGTWKWSECSKKNFKTYYNIITQEEGRPWCMEGNFFYSESRQLGIKVHYIIQGGL